MESGSEYSPSNESDEDISEDDLMTTEEIVACVGGKTKFVVTPFKRNMKTDEDPRRDEVEVPENDVVVRETEETPGCGASITPPPSIPLPANKNSMLETNLPGCEGKDRLNANQEEFIVVIRNGVVYPDEEDRALEPVNLPVTPDDTHVVYDDGISDMLDLNPDCELDLVQGPSLNDISVLNEPDTLTLQDQLNPDCDLSGAAGSMNDTIDHNVPDTHNDFLVPDNKNENPRVRRTSSTCSSEPKKKRNVFANPTDWNKNVSKQARERGEGYVGYRRVKCDNGSKQFTVAHDSPKAPRLMGPTCNSNAYTSIRPGNNRPTEPKVTDLRVLQYQPNGKISFKLNFDDQLQLLPTRPKDVDLKKVSFPRLFMLRLKITKDKYADLQSMKPIIHKDAWCYCEVIPHEHESIRAKRRQTIRAPKTTEEQQKKTKKK